MFLTNLFKFIDSGHPNNLSRLSRLLLKRRPFVCVMVLVSSVFQRTEVQESARKVPGKCEKSRRILSSKCDKSAVNVRGKCRKYANIVPKKCKKSMIKARLKCVQSGWNVREK